MGDTIRELLPVRGLAEKTTEQVRRALINAADEIPMDPDFLTSVISFETAGSFRADIRNPRSNFVGLIQFGPGAAEALGVTLNYLAALGPIGQLRYVVRYFQMVARGKPIETLEDAYLAVFAGRVGLAPTAALYTAPSKAYEQNRELDADGDGVITAGEATRPVRGIYAAARKGEPILVNMSPFPSSEPSEPSC